MKPYSSDQFSVTLGRYVKFVSLLTGLVGVLVLLGWAFEITFLKSRFPDYETMKPLTALGLCLAALALWFAQQRPNELQWRWLGVVCGAMVAMLGAAILLEYIFRINPGIDLWLFPQAVLAEGGIYPGRPAPTTALCLMLLGLDLLCIPLKRRYLMTYLTGFILLVGLLAVVGYVYGVSSFHTIGVYSSMALHTALLLFILGVGILAVDPDHPLTAIWISELAGGGLARRLIWVAIFVPLTLGWLRLQGELLGLYDLRFGLAMFATSSMVIFAALIYWNAALLNKADKQRWTAYNEARISQARLAGIIDSAMDAIVTVDADQHIVMFNAAAEHMFGYAATDMLGQPLDALLPERYRTLHKDHILNFEKTGVATRAMRALRALRPLRGLRSNGMDFPIEASISQVEVSAEKFFTVILRDISERVKTEQILRETESKYRLLVEQTPAIVYVDELNGNWRYLSPQIENITGYSAEEWLADPELFKKRVHQDDLTKVKHTIAQSMATQEPFSSEYRLLTKDDRLIWLSDEAVVRSEAETGKLLLHGVMFDITERKRAEEQVAYQASLLANLNDAIVASDEQFRLTAWNAAAESLYGWRATEVIGRIGVDILQTEFPDVDPAEMRRKIVETGLWRGEATQLCKAGTRIQVEVSSIVLRDTQGQISGYLSVNRDITARKQTEAAMQKLEERFSKAFRASPAGLTITNLEDGTFIEVNESYLRMLEYDREEVIGHTSVELNMLHVGERTRLIQQLREQGRTRNLEIQLQAKSGRFLDALISTELIELNGVACALATIVDITERKQAAEALRAAESKYRVMVENIPAIIYLSAPDQLIGVTYVGPQIEMLGFTQEEWVADPELWIRQIHPEDQELVLAKIHESEMRGVLFDMEYRICARDGNMKWFHDRALYITNEKDEPLYIQGFMQDITDRKQAEKEREARLVLEAKNTELDRFAYTVSHDLKSPLVTIKGFLDYLRKDMVAGNVERAIGDLNYIESAVNKMHELLTGVLELSRAGLAIKESQMISFDELVYETLELLHGGLETAGVQVRVQQNLPMVLGDRLRLRQALQNMIENAIKYQDVHRPLVIEIGARGQDETGNPILFVRDNGLGIPPEFQAQIFDLFVKVDAKSAGSGVGLATVKRIIEVHGGRLWVESEAGMGSTFFFTLPSQPKLDSVI